MAFNYFDRVKETSSTTGTGTITLAGAASGFRTFAADYTVEDSLYYCITDQSGSEWEVGIGKLATSSTLTRDVVFDSSNSGSLVNFTSGSLFVFTTIPAFDIRQNMRAGTIMRTTQGNAFY
jgi:hypothetical protein